MPLGRVARIAASNVDKKTDPDEVPVRLCNYTDVYYNEFIHDDLDFMKASATLREIDAFRLRGGEVLLTKDSETAEDIAKPAFVRPGLEGVVCGYHLYLLRPRPQMMDGRFLMRACSVPPVSDQFVNGANGITRFGLGQQELAGALIPVPPLPKQAAIADFLHRETARIDDLIAQKESLLELLEEQRMAMITRAVTKGLDPGVEMKDSGVEWLNQIPTHWMIASARHLLRSLDQGWSPNASGYAAGPDEWGVLKLSSVHSGEYRPTENKAFSGDVSDVDRFEVQPHDVLLTRANTPRLVGDACYVHETRDQLIFPDLIYRMTARSALNPEFLAYWLISPPCRQQITTDARGSSQSMVKISQSHIKAWVVLLPPRDEQDEIVAHLNGKIDHLGRVQERVRGALDYLVEFRTALISAAVTGKIDVQNRSHR